MLESRGLKSPGGSWAARCETCDAGGHPAGFRGAAVSRSLARVVNAKDALHMEAEIQHNPRPPAAPNTFPSMLGWFIRWGCLRAAARIYGLILDQAVIRDD